MWRLIHEVNLGRSCDSLRHELEKEVAYGVNALIKADSVIARQQEQITLRDQSVKVQTERILNGQAANQELRKEIRRQKGLTIAVTAASILAIIIIL